MKTLIAVLAALVLASPALAQPKLPPDKQVPMVRNSDGDPTALPAESWRMVDTFEYGRCMGIYLSDGARAAVVLYRTPVVQNTPAVLYVVYGADEQVAEWAGNLKDCDPDAPEA